MILEKIAEASRLRVKREMEECSLQQMQSLAETTLATSSRKEAYVFERTIRQEGIHFICEVKKASPSKGIIAKDFPYCMIAKVYEDAGASCISVLTEPEFFLGSDKYLSEIAKTVSLPVLRKDFMVEEYQIYQAKVLGADCVLFICSILTPERLKKFLTLARTLGLSALVEAHDEEEVGMAIEAGATMIGVNNRNLKTFDVDLNNSIRLRELVPKEILFVAESGIKTAQDVKRLHDAKVNAILIGETLMRATDKSAMLQELRSACG